MAVGWWLMAPFGWLGWPVLLAAVWLVVVFTRPRATRWSSSALAFAAQGKRKGKACRRRLSHDSQSRSDSIAERRPVSGYSIAGFCHQLIWQVGMAWRSASSCSVVRPRPPTKNCFKPCLAVSLREAGSRHVRFRDLEDFQRFHLQEHGGGRVVDAFGLPELQVPQVRQRRQAREALAGDARARRSSVRKIARRASSATPRSVMFGLAEVEDFQAERAARCGRC